MPPKKKKRQVVIVGGGPVGMAMAIDLAQRGITSAIVERRTQEHRIPKGQGLQQRTMEHFHSWGLLEKVRAARVLPPDFSLSGVTAYMNLNTEYWYSPPFREVVNQYYFQTSERVPQYLTERVLRDRLAELPGIESFVGWTVACIEQHQDCVHVGMVAPDGRREMLEGDYAIGCDGSHSTVREQSGIERGGENFDQLMVLAVIHSPELEAGLKRFPPRATYRAMDPELKGHWRFFGRVDAQDTFFFHAPVPPDTTKDNYDFQGLMEKATGFKFRCQFDYVVPSRSLSRSPRLAGSSPTVGSSISSTRGSCIRARTSSTRRRLPPLSFKVLSSARSLRASRASSPSIRACAAARGMPCKPAWNIRLALTVSSRSRVGCWKTMPSCASAGTGSRDMSWPMTSMRPESGTNRPERS